MPMRNVPRALTKSRYVNQMFLSEQRLLSFAYGLVEPLVGLSQYAMCVEVPLCRGGRVVSSQACASASRRETKETLAHQEYHLPGIPTPSGPQDTNP